MLGTAGNLALLSNFQIFVPISLALYVALFVATEKFVRVEFWRKFIEVITSVIFILFCMVWSAHNASREILIDKSTGFHPVTGAVDVHLVDIRSLEGWGEGDSEVGEGRERLVHGNHDINKTQPDSIRIFDHILDQINYHQVDGAAVQRMSQDEWVALLRGLNNEQRRAIGRIPFAILQIRSSDDKVEQVVLFRDERYAVRNSAGDVVGRICLDRIFNTNDAVSGEREAVVISHGASACGDSQTG
jgi:hypothetical protein